MVFFGWARPRTRKKSEQFFKKLRAASPGVYFTFDRTTQTKRTIKPEEFGGDVQP